MGSSWTGKERYALGREDKNVTEAPHGVNQATLTASTASSYQNVCCDQQKVQVLQPIGSSAAPWCE